MGDVRAWARRSWPAWSLPSGSEPMRPRARAWAACGPPAACQLAPLRGAIEDRGPHPIGPPSAPVCARGDEERGRSSGGAQERARRMEKCWCFGPAHHAQKGSECTRGGCRWATWVARWRWQPGTGQRGGSRAWSRAADRVRPGITECPSGRGRRVAPLRGPQPDGQAGLLGPPPLRAEAPVPGGCRFGAARPAQKRVAAKPNRPLQLTETRLSLRPGRGSMGSERGAPADRVRRRAPAAERWCWAYVKRP